ncbi:hypothetical protein [Phenylobacterium sp.]|uniref:hypothetical protein n=1 Tax=Phenylobacterium sp. TaxID=1871053 RepID=UPI002731AE39|nr:hypothetical protein [Phenylobacterium sp.]MDP1873353.1 hypothetical protein [Phenylobacterium sp.]MDP3488872.1 hypothetical protein [Phenylobacterium sp.]
MTHPLQTKDDQWRERPNGAEPVFDPGAAPAGTDAEAGGAHAPPSAPGRARPELPTRPDPNAPGLTLPPVVWGVAAGVMLVAVVIAAIFSF